MPLYAYRCTRCGADEEHIERFSDPPKEQCDACGGPLERLVSATAFHLKGGGWYKDGYGSTRPSSGGDSGGSSSSSSGSSSSGSSSSSGGTTSGGGSSGSSGAGTSST